MKADQYQAAVGGALHLFQQQANNTLKAQGIEPQAFYEWAWQADPQAVKSAMRAHAASRSPKVYAPLVQKYLSNVSPSTEALKPGGFQIRVERNGDEMVCIGGQWMSTKLAAKLGLV